MLYKKHIYHALDVELLVRLDVRREVRRLIALLPMLLSPDDKSLCPPLWAFLFSEARIWDICMPNSCKIQTFVFI